ncbi:MAG: signal peptide peptidase SppA [Bacteroidota bacterium]
MKQFFKFMFASMVGYLLVCIICGLFFFIMVASVASLSSKQVIQIKDKSILTLKLDQPIYERAPSNPFQNFDFGSMKSMNNPGLDDILKSLKKAASDDRIKGIYLDITNIPSGIATIEEIRNALLEFKKSGKFIYAYSEGYSQGAYYLATAADKIFMNPEGFIIFKGLSAQMMFFKGTLEKLEVQAQVIRHGKFKSAIEPFIMDKMSDANREQVEKYVGSIWDYMVTNMAKERKLTSAKLKVIADSLLVQTGADALKYKMVDGLKYKDEMQAELRKDLGIGDNDKINFVSIAKYKNAKGTRVENKLKKEKIAVVYAVGQIQSGEGDDQTIGSDRISEAIRAARTDKSVKAIVLRVNSPGGSALASEIIWREVELARKEKPVVVSMGDVAASGGYYIACAANKIIADPNTITGSIGVFGLIPNMEKFFKNKLGITFDGVNTNEHSDFMSTARPMDEYETKVLQNEIEHIYQIFIKHVADGRKMTTAQVDSIGQGRVWSGVDAKRIGLIDDFGGIDKAIEVAAGLANITDYKLVNYPKQKDPFTQIIEQMTGEGGDAMIKKELGENYVYYQYLKNMSKVSGVQARLPFDLIIY